jgi:hypothetical protein
MCPAKADRAHPAVAEREGQVVGIAVDVVPSPVAGLAVVEPIIDHDRNLDKVGNARQRNAVLGDVDSFFRFVEALAYVDICTPINSGVNLFGCTKIEAIIDVWPERGPDAAERGGCLAGLPPQPGAEDQAFSRLAAKLARCSCK